MKTCALKRTCVQVNSRRIHTINWRRKKRKKMGTKRRKTKKNCAPIWQKPIRNQYFVFIIVVKCVFCICVCHTYAHNLHLTILLVVFHILSHIINIFSRYFCAFPLCARVPIDWLHLVYCQWYTNISLFNAYTNQSTSIRRRRHRQPKRKWKLTSYVNTCMYNNIYRTNQNCDTFSTHNSISKSSTNVYLF